MACWLYKWLRVRARAWARECTSCAVFFSSGIISVVNIFVFGGSVSVQQITYEYSIDDVTATWIEVNLVSPHIDRTCVQRLKFILPTIVPRNLKP